MLARPWSRPPFSVPFCPLTGSAAARRHRDHRARPSARQHPPSWAQGRDPRRDHQIGGRAGHGAACRDNPHAACPAGIHQRDLESDLDQHIRAGRSTAADMRGSHKCQRTRLTAPPKAKQPPAPTAALPPKGTTGRLATGLAPRFTARVTRGPAPRGRSRRPHSTQPGNRGTSNPGPKASRALPHHPPRSGSR